MLHGVPVWIGAMEKKCNKIIYTRVQRLVDIKIAKAYRTTSGEALCVLTGITPIDIQAGETAKLYRITRDRQNHELEHEVEQTDWIQPADLESANKLEKRNIRFTYTLMEARTNMEWVRGLLYTYKTN